MTTQYPCLVVLTYNYQPIKMQEAYAPSTLVAYLLPAHHSTYADGFLFNQYKSKKIKGEAC